MVKANSLKLNLLLNIIKTSLAILFPLITYPYVTRVLLPEGLGKIEFVNSLVSYFIVIAGFGIPVYGLREVSKYRNDRDLLSKKVHELFILNTIATVVVFSVYIILVLFSEKLFLQKELCFILGLSIIFTTFGMDWVYQGFEDYLFITIRNFIFQVLSLVLLFLLVKSSDDYLIYAGLLVLSPIGSSIINFFLLGKYIDFKIFNNYQIIYHIKNVLIIFVTLLMGTLLLKLEAVLLGLFLGYADVGIYSVANKLINMIVGVIAMVGMTFLPTIIHHVNKNDEKYVQLLLNKSINFVIFITIPMIIGLFCLSDEIIYLLAGDSFSASVLPFKIMLLIIIFNAVSVVYGNQVFLAYHQERKSLFILMIAGLIGIVLNFILIPLFNVSGAALAVTFSSFIAVLLQYFFAMKYAPINILTIQNLKSIIMSLFMGIIILVSKHLLSPWSPIILVIIPVGVVVYFSGMAFLKDDFTSEILSIMKKKISDYRQKK